MIKRVDRLEGLAGVLGAGNPTKVSLDLGKRENEIGVLVTYVDADDERKNYSARVESSPVFEIKYGANGETSMDITDSNGESLRDIDDLNGRTVEVANSYGIVQDAFRNLKPEGRAIYENPTHKPDDLGTLIMPLENRGAVTLAHYRRAT